MKPSRIPTGIAELRALAPYSLVCPPFQPSRATGKHGDNSWAFLGEPGYAPDDAAFTC